MLYSPPHFNIKRTGRVSVTALNDAPAEPWLPSSSLVIVWGELLRERLLPTPLRIHFDLISSLQVFPLKHYQDKIRPYIQLPSHRNITGVVEVILGDTKAYVFFEKDFGDMHSYVRSCKRLREEEAARLFKQIVSAVAHCHQSAIVLGDLKLRKFVFSNEER